jgi:hypothetical protein
VTAAVCPTTVPGSRTLRRTQKPLSTQPAAVGPHRNGAISAPQNVVASDETSNESADPPLEDLARRAGLADMAVLHYDHQVGQGHRLILAVGDVDEGDAEFLLRPLKFLPYPGAEEGVERREGFIEL